MQTIKEWEMIQELMDEIDDLNTDQQNFITDLFKNLDPHLPFLEQQSQSQLDWLYTIHDFYVNGNSEAFDDYE